MGVVVGQCDMFASRTGECVLSLLVLARQAAVGRRLSCDRRITQDGGYEITRGSRGLGEVGGVDGGCMAGSIVLQHVVVDDGRHRTGNPQVTLATAVSSPKVQRPMSIRVPPLFAQRQTSLGV